MQAVESSEEIVLSDPQQQMTPTPPSPAASSLAQVSVVNRDLRHDQETNSNFDLGAFTPLSAMNVEPLFARKQKDVRPL